MAIHSYGVRHISGFVQSPYKKPPPGKCLRHIAISLADAMVVIVVKDKNTRHKKLLASNYRYFLLVGLHQFQLPIRTPSSAHQSNDLRNGKSGHACRARAQLIGHGLRGPKSAEK